MSKAASPARRVERHGVTIIGASNLARSLAADSSALFARNLYNFLSAFWDKDAGAPVLPDDDEIVKAIRLTERRQGRQRAADGRLTGPSASDILIIGGGIAGLSAAAALEPACAGHRARRRGARSASTRRAEARPCSIMRSATRLVRALTLASRPFFDCAARGLQRCAAGPADAGADPCARGRA